MDLKEKSTTQLQDGQTIYIEFALFEIHKIWAQILSSPGEQVIATDNNG